MSKPRSRSYIPLSVDIDGITIPAYLIEPGDGRAAYYVRWLLGGQWQKRSTKQTILHEARRVGADIVRGKLPQDSMPASTLSFDRFVQVQEKHYAQKAKQRKASKTLKKFRTVWADFLKFNAEVLRGRVHCIQQVTDQVALDYLAHLIKNKAAAHGIHSKFGALRAAWNRVCRGNPKAKRTIHDSEKVTGNPWEAIWGELPDLPETDPVQLDLGNGDLQKLLKAFDGRPVAQLFLVVSMWCAGRLEEMSLAEWDWVNDEGYIDIPDDVAKWGKGRVLRVPLAVMGQLKAYRVKGSKYLFAGFVEEYRRLSKRHGKRIRDYSSGTYDLICKHIVRAAKKVGLKGVSHHAIRRTTMELSDQGEEIKATDESSKNLGTTTKNKEGFYVRKSHGRTFYLRADRLYAGLSLALLHYPAVADLMMVEDRFKPKPVEPSEEKVRRILEEMESLSADELLELERQKARRKRKGG